MNDPTTDKVTKKYVLHTINNYGIAFSLFDGLQDYIEYYNSQNNIK